MQPRTDDQSLCRKRSPKLTFGYFAGIAKLKGNENIVNSDGVFASFNQMQFVPDSSK